MAIGRVPVKEEAVLFGGFTSLVGIITEPAIPVAGQNTGVIILNAGIVHRVGPNRMSVELARSLAERGYTVFRFDFSGIGDSQVRTDSLPFRESAVEEAREAMDYLHARRSTDDFILMGICSGGAVSFRTACRDSRVVGAILINARGHLHGNDEDLGRHLRNRSLARHYWRIALFSSFSRKNWFKVVKGKIDYRNILTMLALPAKRLFSGTGPAPRHDRQQEAGSELRTLSDRGVRILHIFSEGDEGLDYMHAVFGKNLGKMRDQGMLEMELVRETNHIFTLLWSQKRLSQIVTSWLASLAVG